MSAAYDWQANALGCHADAVAALREMAVREGRATPRSADERRQAAEGPRPIRDLDCVRGAP